MKILFYLIVIFITFSSFTCSSNRIVLNEGSLTNDMFYLQGEIKPYSGICIIPYKDGKSIKEVRCFKEGVTDGDALSYFYDGSLKRRGKYKKGMMNGLWEQWYADGKLKFQAVYINDSMSGCFKEWYENGNMREEGQYLNNERIGIWKFYDNTGLLSFEKDYNTPAKSFKISDQNRCI